jgi:hypothetical protein
MLRPGWIGSGMPTGGLPPLLVLLLLVVWLALIPPAAAFTLSVFGFGVGLPDIKMPSSAIEVKLVTQRVLDPM